MHRVKTMWIAAMLLLLAGGVGDAQTLTGTVTGTIRDEQGGVLPGATVSLTGRQGTRSSVTDESGVYRFAGVDPGTYTLTAELSGFQTKRQENVVVSVGSPLTLDLALGVGGLQETVQVVAETQAVSTTSSEATSNLSQDILFNLPISRSNAAVNILNETPGITNGSAYGGASSGANALMLDGVDTRDPESGTAWTFYNYNIIQEVEVKGLGAPAEYGGFTGAVVNTVTKSGGNLFSGLFDITYTGDALTGSNVDEDQLTINPALAQPDITKRLVDYTAQFGGPLSRDKAFFYVSAQRYYRNQDPAGPRTIRWEVSPRFNGKVTLQPNQNDNFTFTVQYDAYNVIGRPPSGLEYVVPDAITNREDAPEWVWLTQWRHLFGSNTFLEVKYTGYTGYFDLNPEVEVPGHLDGETGERTGSQGWFALYDRNRNQVNASISHYAEAFGRHDLKFGAEIERSGVRNRYGYVGDIFFYDYGGAPYLAYQYGYDVTADNKRESLFAQDSWRINDRLTVNPGVRLDLIRGGNANAGTVYDTKNLQPRLGFAYDVLGDNTTVLRGHYGQYYEAAFASIFERAVGGIDDFVLLEWNGTSYEEIDRTVTPNFAVQDDIKHPRVDEFTVGFERALSGDLRFQATGVWRENKNLIDSVFTGARWERVVLPVTENDLGHSGTITAYRWANRATSDQTGEIRNLDGTQYLDTAGNVIGTLDAFRKYRGMILALNKRFTNRWQANVSYVLSKSTGTVNNTSGANSGYTFTWLSASTALINNEGRLMNDRRHEFKAYATYQIPRIELGLNAIWNSFSGRTWTPYQQYSASQLNFPQSANGRRIFLEPRGSRVMPAEHRLDLRFDKQFRITSRDRVSVYLDINNVFNNNPAIDFQDRSPSRTITGIGAIPVGAPLALIPPRTVTIGGRWMF